MHIVFKKLQTLKEERDLLGQKRTNVIDKLDQDRFNLEMVHLEFRNGSFGLPYKS